MKSNNKWIYYYLNNERVTQLAHQINPKLLVEETQKSDNTKKIKGNTNFKIGNLFELLGISNETSIEAERTKQKNIEQKFKVSEDSVTNIVSEYLSNETKYTLIDENTDLQRLEEIKNLLRFNGKFKPIIEGKDYLERLSNYDKFESLKWVGECGNINISFFTSKKSIISNSPIHQLLENPDSYIQCDGFGLHQSSASTIINIVPLFFGVKI